MFGVSLGTLYRPQRTIHALHGSETIISNVLLIFRLRILTVMTGVNRVMNFLYGAWFIVGMVLLFTNASCKASALPKYVITSLSSSDHYSTGRFRAILVQFFIQWSFVGVAILTVCCVVGIIAILYCINPAMFRQGQPQGATKSQIDKLKEISYSPEDATIKVEDARCDDNKNRK